MSLTYGRRKERRLTARLVPLNDELKKLYSPQMFADWPHVEPGSAPFDALLAQGLIDERGKRVR